jgi:hypothetical protein
MGSGMSGKETGSWTYLRSFMEAELARFSASVVRGEMLGQLSGCVEEARTLTVDVLRADVPTAGQTE